MALAQEFTVGHWELSDTVHRLADELKDTRRELRRTRDALLDAEASVLWNEAEVLALGSGASAVRVHIVQEHFSDRSLDDLKHLAQRLVVRPGTVALLATESEPGQTSYFTFARSDDLELDAGKLVREACQAIGGRGGGRPGFAQGGGPEGEQVAPALEAAHQSVIELLQPQGT
jgi:alanyl-tRNA synthetase